MTLIITVGIVLWSGEDLYNVLSAMMSSRDRVEYARQVRNMWAYDADDGLNGGISFGLETYRFKYLIMVTGRGIRYRYYYKPNNQESEWINVVGY